MSDIKLNEEQIEEMKNHFSVGRRFLMKHKDGVYFYKHITVYEDGIMSGQGYETLIDFNFLKTFEPFYFGDMFEVVYKGNK